LAFLGVALLPASMVASHDSSITTTGGERRPVRLWGRQLVPTASAVVGHASTSSAFGLVLRRELSGGVDVGLGVRLGVGLRGRLASSMAIHPYARNRSSLPTMPKMWKTAISSKAVGGTPPLRSTKQAQSKHEHA